ncbi:hypothetical protein FKM82_023412 [Ascaphus truei]
MICFLCTCFDLDFTFIHILELLYAFDFVLPPSNLPPITLPCIILVCSHLSLSILLSSQVNARYTYMDICDLVIIRSVDYY